MNLVMIDNLVAKPPSAVRPHGNFSESLQNEPLGPSPKSVLKEHEFTRAVNARFSVCASRLVPVGPERDILVEQLCIKVP